VTQIALQGRLITLSVDRVAAPRQSGKRGKVYEFSRRSRLRLLRLFATLDNAPAMFTTLTYGQKYPTPSLAKKHLTALFKRLQRVNPDASMVWRIELQQRGAPHWHCIIYGFKYISFDTLRSMWLSIIGDEYANKTKSGAIKCPSIKVLKMTGIRHVGTYLAKYLAKMPAPTVPDASTGTGTVNLDDVPYLDGALDAPPPIGRHWGVMGADKLPYAQKIIVEVPEDMPQSVSHKLIYDYKRVMRRHWRGVNRYGGAGASVFTRDNLSWLRYALVHLRITAIIDPPTLKLDAIIKPLPKTA